MIHPACKVELPLDGRAIGRRIRAARKSYRWSIADLAERVGRAYATVAAWEGGSRIPPIQTMGILSRALRRSLDWLVFGTQRAAYPHRQVVRNQTGLCRPRE